MSLLKTSTLIFSRAGGNGGYYQGGVFIDAERSDLPPVEGSLQAPRRLENSEIRLIEDRGFSSSNTFVFFTETLLVGVDEFLKTVPDSTVIKGKTYEVAMIKDWTLLDSDLTHYKVILARKSLSGSSN